MEERLVCGCGIVENWRIYCKSRVGAIGFGPDGLFFLRRPCVPMASVSMASAPSTPCNLNSISPVAIVLNPSSNSTRRYVEGYRRTFGSVLHVLHAVDGNNHSGLIERLLDTGLHFHDLSKLGRRWGMLGNWMSHYFALQHQIEHQLPYQLTMEEDLWLRPTFKQHVESACEPFRRSPAPDIIQLSRFSELLLTSLEGARVLHDAMRRAGVRKSIDQQMLDPAVMGSVTARPHSVLKWGSAHKKGLAWKSKPWVLGRVANSAEGNIWRTRRFTWTEMAMLRESRAASHCAFKHLHTQAARAVPLLHKVAGPPLTCDLDSLSSVPLSGMLTQGTDAVRRQARHGNPQLPPNRPLTWAYR